jgi:hypothetical protein
MKSHFAPMAPILIARGVTAGASDLRQCLSVKDAGEGVLIVAQNISFLIQRAESKKIGTL